MQQILDKIEQQGVKKVYDFSREHLSQLQRRSGESYFEHGCEVAKVVLEASENPSLLSVALLHDILLLENGEQLLERAPLDEEDLKLLRHMHGLRRLHIDENTEDLDRFMEAFLEDGRLFFLRMAHRMNDVRHLARFDAALQKRIAEESLHMYTALAGRVGMHAWRYEMEDICFKHLFPGVAQELEQHFKSLRKLDDQCLDQSAAYLRAALEENKVPCEIDKRIKTLYSAYRKMLRKGRSLEELTDRLALRIVVPEVRDCYLALGVIHELMHPIPGKLKDYIGSPKENGYQSIHTVVYPLPGVTEQPIEIQIRSVDMHEFCEHGPASHGRYKDFAYSMDDRHTRVQLLRNLRMVRASVRSPEQFEEALRTYFKEDQMAIFDQDNNLFHVKKPATVLDFAWIATPQKFLMLKSAKLNGKRVRLHHDLRQGDIVELEFSRKRQATPEWRDFCHYEGALEKLS